MSRWEKVPMFFMVILLCVGLMYVVVDSVVGLSHREERKAEQVGPCFTPHRTTVQEIDSWFGLPARVDVIDGGADYFTVRQYNRPVAGSLTLFRDRYVVGYSDHMRHYLCDPPPGD
jgi:hypothetical protein